MRIFYFLAAFLWAAAAHAAPNVFGQDVQMCSGRPWIDITCNGADPTGAADSTTAIQNTINAATSNDWPVFFPAGTYKVTSKITVEFGGQANNGPQIISGGAFLDGRLVTSGNVLQVQCTGGTTASPVVCNHFGIRGWLTVMGSGAGYVVTIGKTDFSDQQNAVRIEHLVVTNAGAGGAIQANYLTDADLWLSGSTQGGSSSVGAVALEQVQTSKVSGYGSALGASAPGLLIENGASVGDTFAGFGYDPNDNTCISITSATATRNVWVAPYLPCTTAVKAPTSANQNTLVGPTFAGTNMGPTSSGIGVIGRGSLSGYAAPAVASKTLAGADDGTVFSAANATGPATGFTAASLPVTLPNPAQVGSGYTVGFVSDSGKAVVVSTAGGNIVLAGQNFSQLTIGAPNSVNFETAVLMSDGVNFRVLYISQGAALLNGAQTGWPARWEFPGGPGYQATQGDNGTVISSGSTSGGLVVTLPSITAIQQGWMTSVIADGGKTMRVQTNGSNGGAIISAAGARVTALSASPGMMLTMQYDGAVFRVIADLREHPSPLDFGCVGDGTTNDTVCLQAAINGVSNGILYLGRHLYAVNALVAANPISISGPAAFGGINNWPCVYGLSAASANQNLLTFQGGHSSLRHVCIQMGSTFEQNSSGVAVTIGVNAAQSLLEDDQINFPCSGVQVDGQEPYLIDSVIAYAGGSTNCKGVIVGANTTGGNTLDFHLRGNTITASATIPASYGVAIYDLGGGYFSFNDILYFGKAGTAIIPGASQEVIWTTFADTVLGDSDKTNDLLVSPTDHTAVVNGVQFDATWASNSSGGASVSITNPPLANVVGLHFVGHRSYANNVNLRAVEIEDGVFDVTFDSSTLCLPTCGTGTPVVAGLNNDPSAGVPNGLAFRNNRIGSCDHPSQGVVAGGLALGPAVNTVTITGNDFTSVTTPISWLPNIENIAIIDKNMGLDVATQIPTLGVPSGAISLGMQPRQYINGPGTLSSMSPVWTGRRVTLIPAINNITVAAGGNFCTPGTLTLALPYDFTYDENNHCWRWR